MSFVESFSGTNGTWGTEWSLSNNSTTIATQTTDGIYQVFLDVNALAAGDVYEFRGYEKCRSGDTQRVCFVYTLANAQGADGALWASPPLELLHGWDFTLKRLSGTDRTILWSVRAVT